MIPTARDIEIDDGVSSGTEKLPVRPPSFEGTSETMVNSDQMYLNKGSIV
jgi:hypothetical protein